MSALDFDLRIEQGARYRLVVPVLDADGQPLDVSTWTVRGQVRPDQGSPEVVYDLTPALSVSGSTVLLDIPGAASSLWAWTEGVYDVELVDPDSHVTRLLQGRVVVSPETTR